MAKKIFSNKPLFIPKINVIPEQLPLGKIKHTYNNSNALYAISDRKTLVIIPTNFFYYTFTYKGIRI